MALPTLITMHITNATTDYHWENDVYAAHLVNVNSERARESERQGDRENHVHLFITEIIENFNLSSNFYHHEYLVGINFSKDNV